MEVFRPYLATDRRPKYTVLYYDGTMEAAKGLSAFMPQVEVRLQGNTVLELKATANFLTDKGEPVGFKTAKTIKPYSYIMWQNDEDGVTSWRVFSKKDFREKYEIIKEDN